LFGLGGDCGHINVMMGMALRMKVSGMSKVASPSNDNLAHF
jgi:hypothetical protein